MKVEKQEALAQASIRYAELMEKMAEMRTRFALKVHKAALAEERASTAEKATHHFRANMNNQLSNERKY